MGRYDYRNGNTKYHEMAKKADSFESLHEDFFLDDGSFDEEILKLENDYGRTVAAVFASEKLLPEAMLTESILKLSSDNGWSVAHILASNDTLPESLMSEEILKMSTNKKKIAVAHVLANRGRLPERFRTAELLDMFVVVSGAYSFDYCDYGAVVYDDDIGKRALSVAGLLALSGEMTAEDAERVSEKTILKEKCDVVVKLLSAGILPRRFFRRNFLSREVVLSADGAVEYRNENCPPFGRRSGVFRLETLAAAKGLLDEGYFRFGASSPLSLPFAAHVLGAERCEKTMMDIATSYRHILLSRMIPSEKALGEAWELFLESGMDALLDVDGDSLAAGIESFMSGNFGCNQMRLLASYIEMDFSRKPLDELDNAVGNIMSLKNDGRECVRTVAVLAERRLREYGVDVERFMEKRKTA